ncbi:MAG: hypothetical protein H0X25_12215 [Acidobacteriales bacterium]|nr:hypothetical protein [Terriglobales bacterium]
MPKAPDPIQNAQKEYLLGGPGGDPAATAVDSARSAYKMLAVSPALSIADKFKPGIAKSVTDSMNGYLATGSKALQGIPGLGKIVPDISLPEPTPIEHLPGEIMANSLPMIAGGLGEDAAPSVPVQAPARVAAPDAAGPSIGSRLGNVLKLGAKDIASHVPVVGRAVERPSVFDYGRAIWPKASPAPSSVSPVTVPPVIPETDGIPWGTSGGGPLELRGKMIPTDPGYTPTEGAARNLWRERGGVVVEDRPAPNQFLNRQGPRMPNEDYFSYGNSPKIASPEAVASPPAKAPEEPQYDINDTQVENTPMQARIAAPGELSPRLRQILHSDMMEDRGIQDDMRHAYDRAAVADESLARRVFAGGHSMDTPKSVVYEQQTGQQFPSAPVRFSPTPGVSPRIAAPDLPAIVEKSLEQLRRRRLAQ